MKPTVAAATKVAPLPTVDEAKVPPTDFVVPMVATPSVHVTAKPKWSWCHVSTSMFATLCCFPACGLMGLVYAVLSYVDHKSTDYRRSANKRRHAWGWTITSLVFGLLLWGLFIYGAVRFYVPYMKAMHHQKEHHSMSYPQPESQYSKDLLEKMAHRMNEMEMPKLKETPMFGGDDHDMKKHGPDMMETEEERRRHDHHHGHHGGRADDHDSHDSDSDDDDHP